MKSYITIILLFFFLIGSVTLSVAQAERGTDTEVFGNQPTNRTTASNNTTSESNEVAPSLFGWVSLKVGTIYKTPAGSENHYVLADPDKIGVGDILQTQENGILEITFNQGLKATLMSFTEIEVTNITSDSFNILLHYGGVRLELSVMNDQGGIGSAKVSSPIVETQCKGGVYKFAYDGMAKLSEISVVEGSINLVNKRYESQPIELTAGEKLFIPAASIPQEDSIEPISTWEMQLLESEKGSIENFRQPFHAFFVPRVDTEAETLKKNLEELNNDIQKWKSLKEVAENSLKELREAAAPENPEIKKALEELNKGIEELTKTKDSLNQTQLELADRKGESDAQAISVTDLQQKFDTLSSKLVDLEKENQDLKSKTSGTPSATNPNENSIGRDVTAPIDQADKEELARAQALLKTLQQEIDQKTAQIETLKTSTTADNPYLQQLVTENQALLTQKNDLTNQVNQLTKDNARLTKTAELGTASATTLQTESQQLKEELKTEKARKLESTGETVTKQQFDEVQKQLADANQKNAQLEDGSTNQKKTINDLEAKIAELQPSATPTVVPTVSTSTPELAQLKDQLDKQTKAAEQLLAENTNLKTALDTLKGGIAEPVEKIRGLEEQIKNSAETLTGIQAELQKATSERDQLKSLADAKFTSAEALSSTLSDTQKQLDELRKENEKNKNALEAYKQIVERTTEGQPIDTEEIAKSVQLQTQLDELNRLNTSLKGELEKKVAFYDTRIAEMEGSLKTAITKEAEQQLKKDIIDLTNARNLYNQQLQEAQSRIVALEGTSNSYTSLQENYKKLEENYNQLETQLQKLEDFDAILRVLQKQMDKMGENERFFLVLTEDIFFERGQKELGNDALTQIEAIASKLDTYLDKDINIIVEGRADDRPIQGKMKENFNTNWELSAMRATEVVRVLIERFGIPPNRISALARGEHTPLVPNVSEENRQKNRSVRIIVTSPIEKK